MAKFELILKKRYIEEHGLIFLWLEENTWDTHIKLLLCLNEILDWKQRHKTKHWIALKALKLSSEILNK